MSEADITEMADSLRVRTCSEDNGFDHVSLGTVSQDEDAESCCSSSTCSSCSSTCSCSTCSSRDSLLEDDEDYPISAGMSDDLQSCPLHVEPVISRNVVVAVYLVALMMIVLTGVGSYFSDPNRAIHQVPSEIMEREIVSIEVKQELPNRETSRCISVWEAVKCNYGPEIRKLMERSNQLIEQTRTTWLEPLGERVAYQLSLHSEQFKRNLPSIGQLKSIISQRHVNDERNNEESRVIKIPRDTIAMRPSRTHDEL